MKTTHSTGEKFGAACKFESDSILDWQGEMYRRDVTDDPDRARVGSRALYALEWY